jgi:hypothetical protein
MTEPAADLVIEGAHIIPGGDAPAIPQGRIVVRGDRIAAVETADGPPPAAPTVIDGAGLIAIPGLVNVHTHAILTMVRGVAEDMGFAPAYTKGVPQGHMVEPEEAVALARLGALEAMKFGSTLIADTYVHQDLTMPAMAELGLRVWGSGRVHDVDFSGVSEGRWDYDPAIGRQTLDGCLALHQRFHGAENGRMGVQIAAHAPDTCSTAFLEEVRRARDATGMPVTTHLAQSRVEVERIAARDGRTPAELLDDLGLLSDRLIAAHCIHLTDDDIARIGAAGRACRAYPEGKRHGRDDRADAAARRGRGQSLPLHRQHARGHDRGDAVGARHGPRPGRSRRGRLGPRRNARDGDHARRARDGARGRDRRAGAGSEGRHRSRSTRRSRISRPCSTRSAPSSMSVRAAMCAMSSSTARSLSRTGARCASTRTPCMRDAQKAAEALWRRARAEATPVSA